MITLLVILIILEVIAFVWLVLKINSITIHIAACNKMIINSPFKGSLAKIRFTLEEFNKKFAKMQEENIKQKNLRKIQILINTIIIISSYIGWYKKIVPIKAKKKSLKRLKAC